MTISEMHVTFRQYAQQMGMQNVRAILPEQIDLLINQAITDVTNQLIRENLGVNNDRVITDNSKIGQINAFRTLYDVIEVPFNINETYYKVVHKTITTHDSGTYSEETITLEEEIPEKPSGWNDATGDRLEGYDGGYMDANSPQPIVHKILYKAVIGYFTYDYSNRLQGLLKHVNPSPSEPDPVFGKYMFLVDMSINYNSIDASGTTITTPWYPIRIIDSAYLSDTLNDFVLKNRFRSPVACVYKDDTVELYIDKFAIGDSPVVNITSGTKAISLEPKSIRIDCVRYPAKVKYYEDISEGSSIDCNLPESMHGDIVKHAVDLYRNALNGSIQASQGAQQQQQRENTRNNYRDENNQS